MKNTLHILIVFSVLTMAFFSCKKQKDPSPETLYDTLKVNGSATHTLNENTILTLDATTADAVSYLWQPGNYTSPMISITQEGDYKVKITTQSSEYNYDILVLFVGSDCYIPNSFTPNNDGVNDTWHPFFSAISSENYSLNIFDKNNTKLFSTSSKDAAWDGYFNGILMTADYYYYAVSYKTTGGETKNRNGMLQLIL